MEKPFQGTLSVWSGCVYAQARPFTYEDFEFFDLSVSEKGGTSKYASVTKAFRLKQEVLDEVVSESCLSIGKGFFMEWDKIKNHYIYVTQDIKYNGCRTLASKVASMIRPVRKLFIAGMRLATPWLRSASKKSMRTFKGCCPGLVRITFSGTLNSSQT